MRMTFSTVLFDFDGTLADTNGLIVASFQHVLKAELGLDETAEVIYRYFGEPLPVSMARYSPERAEELVTKYRIWNGANHDQLIRNFPGVPEMLAALKAAGVKLGVVTSKMRDTALRGLRVTGLEQYFDVVVSLDDTEKHKPLPDPVFCALERLGEKPGDHVLMVGDSTFDILCGKNAGVKTAVIGWTVIDRAKLNAAEPTHWAETPGDLLALVLGA